MPVDRSSDGGRPPGQAGLLKELAEMALRQAQTVARVGAWAWDLESDSGTWTPELYNLFEHPPRDEPLSYEQFLGYVHPEDRVKLDAAVRTALAGGKRLAVDFRGLLPDGTWRWFATRGTPESRGGKVVGMIGTIQDIDARRRVEEALREREHLLNGITGNSPIPIFVKNRDGTYRYVNDAYAEVVGIPREQILGRTDPDLYPPDIAQLYQANDRQAMESGEALNLEERVRANGEDRLFRVVKFPDLDAGGNVIGVCGISVDITANVRAEQARDEERQRIAADVHDDSVQVMASVALRIETLERSVQQPEQRNRLAALGETVRASIDRLRKLMIELHTPAFEARGMVATLKERLEQIQREHSISYELSVDLDQDSVSVARAELLRIVREALTNVVKHSQASRVEVAVQSIDCGMQVSITDDGIGFEATEASPIGHLGLSSMRSRAHAVGGLVAIQSGPGEGTEVIIWFPNEIRESSLRLGR